jgi:hypothetical protein
MVGGYAVEPDSIEAIDSSSGAKHAMPGQPFSGNQHIAGMDYADHVKAQPWKYQALASHMAKGHDMSAGRMQSLWQKAGNQADFRRRLAMDHAVAHGMRAAAAGKPAGAGRAAGAGRPAPTARRSPGIVQPTGATKLVGWHTWSHAMGVEDEPTSVSCYYLGDKMQMYTLGDDGVVTCDDPNSEEMADGVQPMPDQPPPPIMPSDGTDFLRALLLLNRTASYYSWVVDKAAPVVKAKPAARPKPPVKAIKPPAAKVKVKAAPNVKRPAAAKPKPPAKSSPPTRTAARAAAAAKARKAGTKAPTKQAAKVTAMPKTKPKSVAKTQAKPIRPSPAQRAPAKPPAQRSTSARSVRAKPAEDRHEDSELLFRK